MAALWAAAGHHVKFVSVTNGDIGHWREAGGPLAQRRNAEVQHAAELLGITSEVLDNHDGELLPTLENRRTVTRLIREWKADIVMGPRTNDYHPDHRYTGILVQDAAYMVAVPFFCPDTPHLMQNPVFLYYSDHFQKPYPFQADVVVGIDRAIEQKLDALVGMESQFVEGGVSGSPELIAGGEPKLEERRKVVRESFRNRDRGLAEKYREQLAALYGKEAGRKNPVCRSLRDSASTAGNRPKKSSGSCSCFSAPSDRGKTAKKFRKMVVCPAGASARRISRGLGFGFRGSRDPDWLIAFLS